MLKLLFIVFIMSILVNAQYSSVLLSRYAWKNTNSVLYMGDQNNDGYDDFVLREQDSANGQIGLGRVHFFYGGNPLSQQPAFTIMLEQANRDIGACDINRDGYRDLIIGQRELGWNNQWFKVYYGGPNLDTIPDFQFAFHDTNDIAPRFLGKDWPIDYNGDGFEDLIIVDNIKINQIQTNRITIYQTSENNLLTDYYVYTPPVSTDGFRIIYRPTFSDIDGDGKTDFLIQLSIPNTNQRKSRIIYGDSNFSFAAIQELENNVYADVQDLMFALPDVTRDGKGNIMTPNILRNPYPYWYGAVLHRGNRPFVFNQYAGFNTGNAAYVHVFSPGDVNGDGCNDIVLVTMSGSESYLYLGGNPPPQEIPVKIYYGGSFRWGSRIGDVNGDGVDDICLLENAAIEWHGGFQGRTLIIGGTQSPVGIKENKEEGKIGLKGRINPNPIENKTVLSYNLPSEGIVRIEIYSITGEKIYKEEATQKEGEHKKEIDFNSLQVTTGTYIIKLTHIDTENINSFTIKAVYMK